MLSSPAEYIGAIILLFVVGTAIGNYATSLVYRLPRGLKIAYDPPYCDSCRSYLTTRDMFPFFSWIINRGKCRSCGAAVPGIYTLIEFLCAAFLIAGVILFDSPERVLLVSAIGVFWLVMVSILFTAGKFSSHAVILAAASGLIYRAVADASIFPALKAGYLGLMLGLLCWVVLRTYRKRIPSLSLPLKGEGTATMADDARSLQGEGWGEGQKPRLPAATTLFTLAFLTVGMAGAPYVLALTPLLYLFIRGSSCAIDPTLKDWSWSWSIFAATMLTLYSDKIL